LHVGTVRLDGHDALEHDDGLCGLTAPSQIVGERREDLDGLGTVSRPVQGVGQMETETTVLRVGLELQLEQLDRLGILLVGDQLVEALLSSAAKPLDQDASGR
jgi:hypothetical protein